MARYSDEELLNLDLDQVGRTPVKKKPSDEDLMADVADILALLNEDPAPRQSRREPVPARAPREEKPSKPVKPAKAAKPPKVKKEKRPLTPQEKQERLLAVIAWIQGAVAACLAVGMFLWTL